MPALLRFLEHGRKAVATTHLTTTPVFRPNKQCTVCESIYLVELARSSTQASLDLAEMLKKQWCPHCRYLCELVHYIGWRNHDTLYKVLVWPSPIGEYVVVEQNSEWAWLINPIVLPLEILGYILGLQCGWLPSSTVRVPMQRMKLWELGIAIRPSDHQAIYPSTDMRSVTCTVRAPPRGDEGTSGNGVDAVHIRADYPYSPQGEVGFEVVQSNNPMHEASYPPERRSFFHFDTEVLRHLQERLENWRSDTIDMVSAWASGDSEDQPRSATTEIPNRSAQLAGAPLDAKILQVSVKTAAQVPRFLEATTFRYEKQNIMAARRVDRSSVDWSLSRQWLSACRIVHAHCCKPLQWTGSESAPFVLRMFDVRMKCIVRAPRQCRYAALSYVWGKALHLRATTKQQFTKTNSLAAANVRLPKTIADAAIACERLGLRYLWVDSLCILQDSDEDKAGQIEHMGYVYSGAEVTLVAGYGDNADSGLPGVSDVHRQSKWFEATIVDRKVRATLWNSLDVLMKSPWYSRGWTYQELLLSKRLLCFTDEPMLFFCHKGAFREDLVLETYNGMIDGARNMTSLIDPPLVLKPVKPNQQWADQAIRIFEQCATTYVQRKLIDERHTLDAFAGVLEALMPYLGPYRWGLPINFARSIFTWHSKDRAPLPRRASFPSWSWVGLTKYRHTIQLGPHFSFVAWNIEQPAIFTLTEQGSFIPIAEANIATSGHDEGMDSADSLPEETLAALSSPLNHCVVLYEKRAHLPVDREPFGSRRDEYEVGDAYGRGLRIAVIRLDPEWRRA